MKVLLWKEIDGNCTLLGHCLKEFAKLTDEFYSINQARKRNEDWAFTQGIRRDWQGELSSKVWLTFILMELYGPENVEGCLYYKWDKAA